MGAVFFTIVQIFGGMYYSVSYLSQFGFKGADVFDMLGAQSFVNMVSAFIPLPERQVVQKAASICSLEHFWR